ncbi:hypothetical protein [Undibacterium sp. CCC3.4]|uniref:hypothetical protein n=1 Tax=unclassified Undibacterium TaxID=2630295 RepID=UPI003A103278
MSATPAYGIRGRVVNDAAGARWQPEQWYSHEHRHSGIPFVTPAERHQERGRMILAQRKAVYEIARAKQPERWRGDTRNWTWVDQVSLNPDREEV